MDDKAQTLYQKYVDVFTTATPYVKGYRQISEQDLLDVLGSDLDSVYEDYPIVEDFADRDEPNTLMGIYSINEAEHLIEQLSPN